MRRQALLGPSYTSNLYPSSVIMLAILHKIRQGYISDHICMPMTTTPKVNNRMPYTHAGPLPNDLGGAVHTADSEIDRVRVEWPTQVAAQRSRARTIRACMQARRREGWVVVELACCLDHPRSYVQAQSELVQPAVPDWLW